MPKPFLWGLIAVLFLGVAGLALYRVWPLLNPQVALMAPLDPNCDLRQGACAGVLPNGGRIRFAIQPETLPLAQPLTLSVIVEGLAAQAVEVDFSGVDMNMGYNRPRLSRVMADTFRGNAMLPVCVRERMTWEARVLVHTDRGLLAAPFRFVTGPPGVP